MKNSTFSAQVANNLLTLLQGYSKTIRLLLVMLLTLTVTTNAWAATWEKATSIAAGDVVLLVCESKKMELSSVNSYGSGTAYSTSPAGLYELTVEAGSSSGTFSLKNGNNYLYWSSGNSLATSTSKTTNSSWKITFNSGNLTILNAKDNNRKLQWNASSPRFACYTSSQTAVQLYKKVTAVQTVAVTGVSLNKTSLTLTEGSSETLSASVSPDNATDKTVTWTTNNSSVATVSNGKVTAVAEGSATITVTTNDGNKTATCTVTVTPKPKYTVTLVPCSGSVTDTELEEPNAGAGVTLPTPTLSSACLSEGWSFAGWATASVDTETATEPTLIAAGAYKPTSNITLYAVYKRTEEGEGGGSTPTEVSKTYTFSDYEVGTQYAEETYELDDDVTINIKGCHINTQLRVYGGQDGTVISEELLGRIVSMGFNMGYKADALVVYGSTNGSSWTEVGSISTTTSYKDYTLDFGETNYTYFKLNVEGSSQIRIAKMSITYESTSGGGSSTTTYYHSTPDCGGTPEQSTYTITISNDIQNGTIVADKSSAAEGETVKLTVTPEAGYKLDAITVTKATGGIVEVENKTFTMPASNVTVSATFTEIPKYTVSFSTGTGNSTPADISETVGGAGITLPAGPTPDCSEEGWEFGGWSTTNIKDQTTTISELLSVGSNYKPTKNTTLYAVYSKTESAGNGGAQTTATLTNEEIAAKYVNEETTKYGEHTIESKSGTWGGMIVIGNLENTKYIQISSDKTNRHLASPTFSANITNITIKGRHNASKTRNIYICSSNETAQPSSGDLGYGSIASSGVENQYTDWTDVSITVSGSHTKFYVYADGGLQIHSIIVTIGGSTTTTYYHSNPCEVATTPTWEPARIDHNTIQVACGSKTQLGAAAPNGPATISFSGTYLQNAVRVTASEGFLVSTDKTTLNKYATEVPINPYKEGQNAGKLPNVHVIADAPAQSGDYTGTITLTGNDIPGGEQVINVTAAVTCTQYTITWSVNGDTEIIEPTTFYAGDEWDLPENPDFDCNGREFVGWTISEISGETPNAPDVLYKSKGDFPEINEDKTFYAVFATSSGDDSNETTVSVSIADYAETNSWKDATQYTTINISSDITATAKGESNTGKYYDNGKNWRLYQTETPTLTFNAANKILSITITYTSDKTGVLTFNGSNIDSGTASEINATSAEFGVGNTGSATNGQVRITDISVTYSGGGGGHSGYTTNCDPCINSNFTISESNFTISKDSTLNLGALIQTDNQSTIIYTCNTPNGTITADGLFSATESGTYTVTINQDSDDQDHCAVNKTITIKVVGEIVTLKWSVNGATNTNLSPGTVEKNTPIGTLPMPKTGCDDKQFMGWTTTSTVNNDGSDIEYIKATTTPTENTTYYAVFASESNQNSEDLEEIFNESFNNINGQGGNDEQWNSTDNNKVGAGTKAIDSLITNHSWNITKGYEAHQCVKMGASSAQGIITTPAINQLDGNAVLTFKAGAWDNDGEKLDIIVEVSGGATISPSAFTLKKAQFDTYTANITGGNSETKITIKAKEASKNRFFIDDIRIAAGAVSFEDYTTRCGTYTVTYHGFGGYSTICGDNPAEKVVEVGSTFTVATCTPEDPKGLGRIFAGEWYTNPNGKGDTYKPGDTFVVEEDITLYAQWALNTSENTTLPTDVEDLATTDIVVTGGTTLTLQADTTTINSLTLKGGLLVEDDSVSGYAMPVVNIPTGATLVRKNTTINLDLVVNNDSWYPFAVPFEVENTAANVNYINPTLKEYANANKGYGKYYRILEYDGAKRADKGLNNDSNWVHVGRTDVKLMPGKGYAISAVPAAGDDTVTIRITMNVDNAWLANGEQDSITVKETTTTRNAVAVAAHTGAAATEHQRHAGWNFVANPYLSNFAGTNASGSFITGELLINKGEYYYDRDDDVPYVTIPTYNFAHYYQVKLSEATLSPAYSFFVQVGKSGTMTFATDGRQQAPASIAARNAEERPVKMDVDITLSDNHSSDQTGIIISDRYSEAYEIGRDLEKMFGSAANLTVYTLMADNTPLAFQALAIRSNMQVIPVGYRAPEQGEYTFRLNEATSSIDLLNEQYEQLVLVDYQTGELTNLLISDYTFYSERTQADNRFAIYAVPRQNAPTDLPNAIGQDKQAQKIIHNGHLYILRDGNVYNGNGQIVK